MKLIRNISIRYKIQLSFVFLILFCFILFSVSILKSSNTILRKDAQSTIAQILLLAQKNLEIQTSNINQALYAIQSNNKLQSLLTGETGNYLDEIHQIENELYGISAFHQKIISIKIFSLVKNDYPKLLSSGSVYSSSVSQNEPWFSHTIEKNGHTHWEMFYSDPLNGIISASRLILDTKTDKPIAVARIEISLISFLENINSMQLGNTGKLFLVNKNHIFNPDNNQLIKTFVNEPEFKGIIFQNEVKSKYINISNIEYLISFDSIQEMEIFIVGAVPAHELDAVNTYIAYSTSIATVTALILSVFLFAFLSNYITKPILHLAMKMKDFEKTERMRVEISSNDEIGFLYKSFNKMLSTIDHLIEDVNQLFLQQKKLELKALQAQINPHFLYNTLDSINWLAQKNSVPDISRIVEALANFFRHSLNKGLEFTTVRIELEHVMSYVEIQKIRFKDAFNLTIDVEEEILDIPMIKLCLQPIIENSIVHGFEDIDYIGEIKITGYKADDVFFIKVSDNGVGADVTELNNLLLRDFDYNEPMDKYGISNVNQRIKLYFGNNCELHFESNVPRGVTVVITLREITLGAVTK